MDFETFKDKLAEDVKEALESKTGENYEVEGRTVEKMNETYEALTVKPEDSIVGVNLNATALYEAYENGTSYDTILEGAVDIADNALDISPVFDLSSFTDYDKMKDTLAMEVVSAEKNAAILETVPHKEIEDMAVVYRFVLQDVGQGPSSILVTNQMIENYGVSPEQLHEDAVKNAPEIRPMVIEGMAEVLAKQMGVEDVEMLGLNMPPDQEQMYVASVEGNVHGAGVLAYQDFMDKAAERAGGDFFILPSSIHEVLIIPDNGTFDLKHLEAMVKEVNATTVDPSDQLTDNVYHYDSKEKIFELGEKFVNRQHEAEKAVTAEKEDVTASVEKAESKEHEKGEKKSLLNQLRTDKADIAKQPKKEAVEKDVKHKGEAVL